MILTKIQKPILALMLGLLGAAQAGAAPERAVQAELLSEQEVISAGKPFDVAIRFQIAPHWHTYWRNPGDAGLATEVKWLLPYGFRADEIRWPAPQQLPVDGGLMNYGYTGEVWHLVRITPGIDLSPGRTVRLEATVDWLECKENCVPGRAKLVLDLKIGAEPKPGALAPQFVEARKKLPQPAAGAPPVTAYRRGAGLILELATERDLKDLNFFPYEEQVLNYAAVQKLEKTSGKVRLVLTLASPQAKLEKISGVLVSSSAWNDAGSTAVEISGPVGSAPQTAAAGSLFWVLLLGFAGGLILNLMPCVFPVLAVKILGFVTQAGEEKRKVAAHGFSFAAGVLVSFWILGGLLLALRAGGQQLGWGFQLQSPAFVYGLAVLFFLFGLNLSGVFEVGLSAIGVGSGLAGRSDLSGSFFSGVLAAVAATPCAAPFLAPALGAALVLSPGPALLLFTCIALGLALPYLLLSLQPGWLKILPRPGLWMETFKQVLAFPLFATAAYLVWVLDGQVDETRLLHALFSFPLLALAVWIYGRWSGLQSPTAVRRLALAALIVLLGGALWWAWPRAASGHAVLWEKWSPERVEQLRGEGRPVYVDFTARWCATCQTNKAVVFSSDEVLRELKNRNVALLRADWTNRDPQITAELARWQRSAVPFDLIYLPGHNDPVILPEVLTPQTVLRALEK